MAHSSQGIVRDNKGEEQPADKQRAQTAQKTDSRNSVSREATRNPKLTDAGKTPGSGMAPDDDGGAPTG
jgi:hypothetical protein